MTKLVKLRLPCPPSNLASLQILIRVQNCTNPQDLISYSTQDPQFLINSYKPQGDELLKQKMQGTVVPAEQTSNHISIQDTMVNSLNKTTAATHTHSSLPTCKLRSNSAKTVGKKYMSTSIE